MTDETAKQLLKRLIAENPDADDNSIVRLLAITANEEQRMEIVQLWLDDHLRTLEMLPRSEIDEWVKPRN